MVNEDETVQDRATGLDENDGMTLMQLTGHESGIVIYSDGGAIICNWSQMGEDYLPSVLCGTLMVGIPDRVDIGSAQEMKADSSLLDSIEDYAYVENEGDTEAFESALSKGECQAWRLPDDTIVVVCDGWC